MKRCLFILLGLFPVYISAQSIEVSYLSGASTSLFAQNKSINHNLLEMRSVPVPFPNFIGEASLGYNFFNEKFNVNIAYNQLVYSYDFKTAYIYPDFFAKDEISEIFVSVYNNTISTSLGYNLRIKSKIIFRPYFSIYMGFNRGISSSSSTEFIPVPHADSSISVAKITYEDNINFRTSVMLGIGYKFNFYATKWLFFTIGSRYTRGFRKDFDATLRVEMDGEVNETQKIMRSSNFSVDLGLGVKFDLKKNNNGKN